MEIEQRMQQHLREWANCTCEQTIRQYRPFLGWPLPLQHFSRVHLQVAYVSGRELWARREGEPFSNLDLHAWARDGAVANGGFALLAEQVFSLPPSVFQYRGEERLQGRIAARYDFRVLPSVSDWILEVGGKEAKVGYHGSFWAEELSGDIMRVETEADEIPSRLGLDRFVRRIDYGWHSVGDSALYGAESADLQVTPAKDSGRGFGAPRFQTRTRWNRCRRFRTNATIHYEKPSPLPQSPTETSRY